MASAAVPARFGLDWPNKNFAAHIFGVMSICHAAQCWRQASAGQQARRQMQAGSHLRATISYVRARILLSYAYHYLCIVCMHNMHIILYYY